LRFIRSLLRCCRSLLTGKSREHLECIFAVAKNADVVPDKVVVHAVIACVEVTELNTLIRGGVVVHAVIACVEVTELNTLIRGGVVVHAVIACVEVTELSTKFTTSKQHTLSLNTHTCYQ
jgi:hypothetical protein